MQRLPYTFEHAKSICNKLQHIIGQVFDINDPDTGNVECVAVTPFDHINKKKFLLYYLLCNSAESALAEDYKGLLFDVCVIARSVHDDNDLKICDIDTWLAKNNITMDDLLLVPGISTGDPIDDEQIFCN